MKIAELIRNVTGFIGTALGVSIILANIIGAVTQGETLIASIPVIQLLGISYMMHTISKSS